MTTGSATQNTHELLQASKKALEILEALRDYYESQPNIYFSAGNRIGFTITDLKNAITKSSS